MIKSSTVRLLTGLVAFLSLVCLGLDIARVCFDPAEKKSHNTVLVYVTDCLGLLSYTIFTWRMNTRKTQHRFLLILYRILFYALAMIAPCLELKDAHTLNQAYSVLGPIDAFGDSDFMAWITEDLGRYCWGDVRPGLEMADTTDNIQGACMALRARTILSLILAFFVLIEAFAYKISKVGAKDWVEERSSFKAETRREMVVEEKAEA